jgi:UDP-glucose 4-epimerase
VQLVPYEDAYEEGFEDMQRRVPDISKIRATIGWSPTRSLDEIITDVVEYHRRMQLARALSGEPTTPSV